MLLIHFKRLLGDNINHFVCSIPSLFPSLIITLGFKKDSFWHTNIPTSNYMESLLGFQDRHLVLEDNRNSSVTQSEDDPNISHSKANKKLWNNPHHAALKAPLPAINPYKTISASASAFQLWTHKVHTSPTLTFTLTPQYRDMFLALQMSVRDILKQMSDICSI